MCLGGLVVIWGLFTKTESASFHLSDFERSACLVLAFLIVLVLSLDVVEYLIGLRAYRELAGDVIASSRDHFSLRNTVLFTKLGLALLTLVGLCGLFGLVLVDTPVHAQARGDTTNFKGYWCGIDSSNDYMCLDVPEDLQMELEYSFDNMRNTPPAKCAGSHIDEEGGAGLLKSQCGAWLLLAFRDLAALRVQLTNGKEVRNYLLKQDRR
jgi:hypothetical protein